jgi:hypothetical protein
VSVCLLDTSILCEILEVPGRCDHKAEVLGELEEKVRERESLLLPMSAIVETGNHIGQSGDGRQRRKSAGRFVALVQQAIRGETPFTPTPFFETEALLDWLGHFPDWAMRGSGLADLTIAKEFERQCTLHRQRRVYIGSLDGHLSSYRREP